MKSTSERGYGTRHQAVRQQWAARIASLPQQCVCDRADCPHHTGRCRVVIDSSTNWDLGHTDDRTAYTGPECIPCNRGAGARNSNKPRPIRRWSL